MEEVKKPKEEIGNKTLLPIVAESLFVKDFALGKDTKATQAYYYKEQCAMKWLFGIKANIKFI